MSLRFLALGTLAVLSTVGVSSAVAPVQRNGLHAISSPGDARLYAFGTRSVQQRASAEARKLDSVLADLARHLTRVRPAHQLADLHSLSPAARFIQHTAAIRRASKPRSRGLGSSAPRCMATT